MDNEFKPFIKHTQELIDRGFAKNDMGYFKNIGDGILLGISNYPHNADTFQVVVIDMNAEGEDQEGEEARGVNVCTLWNLNVRSWEDAENIERIFSTTRLDLPDVEYI